jgi:hypothetical protein
MLLDRTESFGIYNYSVVIDSEGTEASKLKPTSFLDSFCHLESQY